MEDLFNDEIILTATEEKVLKMLAAGKKSTEIAEGLHLSLSAIKWYRQRLKSKFNAATTGEMLMKAVAQKIL
ncbi:MAG: helix-turn-helix transcriptional regulator [Bacteroidales bacterium]|nr:helix-turn-helix transcriptional regulator [Bacteroidales bacterium]MBR6267444.1 helix-turn-helix transcriptional regulator [Selenomonadaceae bacterium]